MPSNKKIKSKINQKLPLWVTWHFWLSLGQRSKFWPCQMSMLIRPPCLAVPCEKPDMRLGCYLPSGWLYCSFQTSDEVLNCYDVGILDWSYYVGDFEPVLACMFDDNLWKSYVCRTTFSNVKYQDLFATINPSKIKYVQNQKQSLNICATIFV